MEIKRSKFRDIAINKISLEEAVSIFIIFGMGIIVYYQMAVDWLTNPDTVWNALYVRVGHGSEKNGGRLLQIIMDCLRGGVVSPVLMLIISIAMLTISSFLICRLFYIKKKVVYYVMVGFLVLLVPCTSSSLTFYYCSDSFQLAFLCVICGVYLIRHYQTYRAYILALILFTSSLFLYQAYICVAFTICAIFLLMDAVCKEFKSSYKDILKIIAISGCSCIVYAVLFRIFRIVFHIEIQNRMEVDTKFSFNTVAECFNKALHKFSAFFFTNDLYHNDFGYRYIINICIWIIVIGLLVYGIFKNREDMFWQRICSGVVGLLFLPFTSTAIVFLAPKVYATVIMLPTMVFIYILPIILCNEIMIDESEQNRLAKRIVCIFIVALIWNFMAFTNLCISTMKIKLNKTETVAALMIDRVIQIEGYSANAKLLISGAMEDGNFPDVYEEWVDLADGTYMRSGYMWHNYYANEEGWINFLKQYHGIAFQSCSTEEYEEFLKSEIYDQTPVFPESGSIIKWNDMIVVKMSNVELE